MLAGRYSETRIRELKPRIAVDRLENTVRARRGALLAVYLSGGVIPNRGYYQLRRADGNVRLGELDEEFVWEASIGQTFTLGTQSWRIERITHNDVFVRPAGPTAAAAPFWRADLIGRDAHFSRLISRFIDRAEEELPGGRFRETLESEYRLEPAAAEGLIRFLEDQRGHTNGPLPNNHNLLIEHVASGPGGVPGSQVIIHTLWGGRVNRPLALALESGLARNPRGPVGDFSGRRLHRPAPARGRPRRRAALPGHPGPAGRASGRPAGRLRVVRGQLPGVRRPGLIIAPTQAG